MESLQNNPYELLTVSADVELLTVRAKYVFNMEP